MLDQREIKGIQFCDLLPSYLCRWVCAIRLVSCQLSSFLSCRKFSTDFRQVSSAQWGLVTCSLFLHAAALCSSADFQPLDLSCCLSCLCSLSHSFSAWSIWALFSPGKTWWLPREEVIHRGFHYPCTPFKIDISTQTGNKPYIPAITPCNGSS